MTEKRTKLAPRMSMPEQPAELRVNNFLEVPLGYTPEQAQAEAERCLDCRKPKCVAGCPVQVDIPAFLSLVAAGRFAEAAPEDQGQQLPAGGLRPRLPAREPVRRPVRVGQAGRAGGDRRVGAVCRRF